MFASNAESICWYLSIAHGALKPSFASTIKDVEVKVQHNPRFGTLTDKMIDDSHKWPQPAALRDNSNRAATYHTRHVASQTDHIIGVMGGNKK
jgi:hypothetical protein